MKSTVIQTGSWALIFPGTGAAQFTALCFYMVIKPPPEQHRPLAELHAVPASNVLVQISPLPTAFIRPVSKIPSWWFWLSLDQLVPSFLYVLCSDMGLEVSNHMNPYGGADLYRCCGFWVVRGHGGGRREDSDIISGPQVCLQFPWGSSKDVMRMERTIVVCLVNAL